jgi:hypothetical protein
VIRALRSLGAAVRAPNLGNARTGMVMGIVTTILSVLVIGGIVVLFAYLGTTDYSLV